jgi:naringenin degradation protein FdeH
MPLHIRRIVTGHNAQGKSVFIMDGEAHPPAGRRNAAGTSVVELWQTDCTPADNSGDKDPTDHPYRLPPPANGSVFRVVEYPPDKERFAAMSAKEWSADAASQGYQRDASNQRHAGFHKTDTIDYAVVLEGEIYALMDEGEKLMKTGDVLIQRGTSHAWSNRSDKAARVAFILIDAKPV